MNTLDELEKLLAAATPLPWWVASMNPNVVSAGARDVLRCHKSADARGTAPSANAALICAAVNALPELLERVNRLEAIEAAARNYFALYCQDEAADDGPEMTGCGQSQHESAKMLRAALLRGG